MDFEQSRNFSESLILSHTNLQSPARSVPKGVTSLPSKLSHIGLIAVSPGYPTLPASPLAVCSAQSALLSNPPACFLTSFSLHLSLTFSVRETTSSKYHTLSLLPSIHVPYPYSALFFLCTIALNTLQLTCPLCLYIHIHIDRHT